MSTRYIIFHHDDLDGYCSAFILKSHIEKLYGSKNAPIVTVECKYDSIEKQYEMINNVNIKEGDVVYIVDFSFDPPVMSTIQKIVKPDYFIWIDHHSTAIEKMKDLPAINGRRDTSMSATMITWEYCHKNQKPPLCVQYVNDYDIWNNKDQTRWYMEVLPFKYGMESENWDDLGPSCYWHKVFEDNSAVDSTIINGTAILKYVEKSNLNLAESKSYEIKFDGKRALVVNHSLRGSGALEQIFNTSKHDIMLVYSIENTGEIVVGIYTTKKDIHVGNIAKKFGGGGHPGAAGFKLKIDQLELLLPQGE